VAAWLVSSQFPVLGCQFSVVSERQRFLWELVCQPSGVTPADVFLRRFSGLHPLAYNRGMANLTLVYGLRLLPSDEVTEVGSATIKLKNGRDAHVTMHTLEGSKDEIEKQLKTSLAAFFDIYPEI
jgi:hypothetical protein